MSKKLEGLKTARALIAKPGGWTRGVCARTKYGHQIRPESPSAARFCAYGALIRALPWAGDCRPSQAFRDASNALRQQVPGGQDTSVFNDAPERKQDEVVALYDRAIAAVEAEEASRGE